MRKRHPYPVRCLFLLVLAFGTNGIATAAPADPDVDCYRSADDGERHVDSALFATRTPLYLADHGGQITKLDLATGARTILSQHDFANRGSDNFRLSPDRRWLSYDGVEEGSETMQYWLYDLQADTDRLVYQHPAPGGGTPVFSPDSRYLAIAANYDKRWGNVGSAGLFVFDIAASRLLTVPLNTDAMDEDTWALTSWSKDGKELLIVLNQPDGEAPWYYVYRPATQALERLSGRYDAAERGHVFERAAHPIPQAEASVLPRSQARELSAWSPGEKWHAYLAKSAHGATFDLKVAGKDGVATSIDAGRSRCAEAMLRIVGWLDGRYLVYVSEEDRYRVYDAQARTTADLFGDAVPESFSW